MLLALVALASLTGQATPGTGPAPYWQQRVAYTTSTRRSTSRRGCSPGTRSWCTTNNSPDTLRQLELPPLPQRLPPRHPLGRRRFDRAQPPVQRPEGPELRLQPRLQRPDHGPAGPGHLPVRARQHHRPVHAPPPAGARRLAGGRHGLGRAALDPAPPPGPPGPGLRLRPVVPPRGGLRPVRLGGAPAVPRRRVLRRVRHLPRPARRAGGPGHGRHRRAGLRRPGLGPRQPAGRPPHRLPARLLRRPDPASAAGSTTPPPAARS